MQKGQAQRSAIAGKTPSSSSHVTDYMKKTATTSQNTAKKIDNVLQKVSCDFLFFCSEREHSTEYFLARGHRCERSEGTKRDTEEDGNQKTRVITGGT